MAAADALRWIDELYPRLTHRASWLKELEDWYCGEHPLPFLTKSHAPKMRSEFRQMLEESRSNFMRLLIDVVDERMQIEGIRLSATSDATTDKDSWDTWQANQMDSLSRAAILDSLIKGVSYVSVWEDANGDGYADLAVEDASETIVAYTPGSNFRLRDAALKVWRQGDMQRANVWMPDALYKFERDIKQGTGSNPGTKWQPVASDDAVVSHIFGVVPVIPIRNRGRLLVEGESEIADATSVQSQINGFLFLLALAGYFGAHRQRWATGIKLMEDEENGDLKEPFDIAIDKLIVDEDENARFGEFAQTDLTQYIKAIDQKVAHLAITTRTPKHYLLPDGQDPSGDAIKSSESGLIRRVERKQSSVGEAFEEVARLGRMAEGKGETQVDSEVVWSDASTESEAVRTDAVIKTFQAGLIPAEQALEDLGYTQTQIARIMRARASEAILSSFTPPPEPKPAPGGSTSSIANGSG